MLRSFATKAIDFLWRATRPCLLLLAEPVVRGILLYKKALDRDSKKQNVVILSMGRLSRATNVCLSAKKKGFRVHLFCQEFPVVEARFADRVYLVDCQREFDRALKISREINPVAILVESKNLILPMQRYLATALGLNALSQFGIEASNSKAALRDSLDRAGLVNVPWADYFPGSPSPISFPLVLKPNMGTSSKGVVHCDSQRQLDNAFEKDYLDKLRSDVNVGDTFLVEGFVRGRQFDVEGVASGGIFHVFTIVEEFYEAKPPYFPPDWFHFNPPISNELRETIVSGATAALRAIGVSNGGFHVELRVTDDGTVVPIDFANRLGYNTLVSFASGANIVDKFVDIMVAGDTSAPMLNPISLVKIYAKTPQRLRVFHDFSRRHPERVLLKNFVGYEFSYHWYYGDMTIKGTDYDDISQIMTQFGILPREFEEFY